MGCHDSYTTRKGTDGAKNRIAGSKIASPRQRTGTVPFTGGLVAVGVIWLADVVWSHLAGIRLAHGSALLIAIAILLANLAFYRGRAGGERAAAMTMGFVAFFAIASGETALIYLAATADRPLIDSALAAGDAALGFDWLGWYQFVQAHDALRRVLDIAYATMGPQIVLCLVVLPMTGRFARNREWIISFTMALTLAVILFGIFPAEGAWIEHGVRDPAGLPYLQTLRALRAGQFTELRLDQLDGLITFPSFHIATAVLLIYASRGTPWMPLAIVLNITMAVAAISQGMGGHYLMDGIGGIAVSLTGIAIAQLLARKVDSRTGVATAVQEPLT